MKIINFPISQLIEFPLKNINILIGIYTYIYFFKTFNQITFNDNIMKHYSYSLRSIMKIVKKEKNGT